MITGYPLVHLSELCTEEASSLVYAGLILVVGSGRVTFCSHKSYMRAVNAAFVEIKTPKFVKKVISASSLYLY